MNSAEQRITLSTANSRLVMENQALWRILDEMCADLAKAWSFDNDQQHTHSWHDKQDFIEKWTAIISQARKETENTR